MLWSEVSIMGQREDNGSPWGSDSDHRFTELTAWLGFRLWTRFSREWLLRVIRRQFKGTSPW